VKDFCPNFPKLARKVVGLSLETFSINIKDYEDRFWYDLRKRSSCVFLEMLGAIFLNQTRLAAIFAQIFSNFNRIFHKSKLLGVR